MNYSPSSRTFALTHEQMEVLLRSVEASLRALEELTVQIASWGNGSAAYLILQQRIVELTQSRDLLRAKLEE